MILYNIDLPVWIGYEGVYIAATTLWKHLSPENYRCRDGGWFEKKTNWDTVKLRNKNSKKRNVWGILWWGSKRADYQKNRGEETAKPQERAGRFMQPLHVQVFVSTRCESWQKYLKRNHNPNLQQNLNSNLQHNYTCITISLKINITPFPNQTYHAYV